MKVSLLGYGGGELSIAYQIVFVQGICLPLWCYTNKLYEVGLFLAGYFGCFLTEGFHIVCGFAA